MTSNIQKIWILTYIIISHTNLPASQELCSNTTTALASLIFGTAIIASSGTVCAYTTKNLALKAGCNETTANACGIIGLINGVVISTVAVKDFAQPAATIIDLTSRYVCDKTITYGGPYAPLAIPLIVGAGLQIQRRYQSQTKKYPSQ